MKKPRAAAIATFRHGPSGLEVAIGLRRGEPEKGEWGYPGGHVEDGESPRDGAARELEEEAGVRVDPTSLEYIITQNNTHEVFIFGVEVDEKTQLTSGSDMADMRWISVDQLPKLAFNGNRYVIKAMRKMKLDETTPVRIEDYTLDPAVAQLVLEYAIIDKKKRDEPKCPSCGGVNNCPECEFGIWEGDPGSPQTWMGMADEIAGKASVPSNLTPADTEPSWKCEACLGYNDTTRRDCESCGEPRKLGLRGPLGEDIGDGEVSTLPVGHESVAASQFIASVITEDPDILVEYRCPGCGDPDAYAGINKLECPNYACNKFSQKRADELNRKPPTHQTVPSDPPTPAPARRADFCMNCGLSTDKCGCSPYLRHWP